MSINSILNTGARGMAVSTAQTQVASNNVSNAATVGYTRRTLVAYPENALSRAESAKRVQEPFIQKRVLDAQSTSSEATAYKASVDVLDTVFSDDDGNVGPALDNFQAAINGLNSRPDDVALRQQVLTEATNLSRAFNNANDTLQQARLDGNTRIQDSIRQVNQKLHEISKLSGQISTSEVSGVEASALRDQRDLLISQVAERVPVTAVDQGNGQVSLTLNGQHSLVAMDGKVTELTTDTDDSGAMRISRISAGASVDVTASVGSGTVGAQLKTFSGPLSQAKQRLDQLAYDVANAYNTVHAGGVGLDGASGRNLFTPPAGVADAARNLAVSADVADAPRNLAAAADAAGLPSDNRNALALAQVSAQKNLAGGQSINDVMSGLVGFAGSVVQSAGTNQNFASGALEQVQALRDNVSGVSSDEEMVELMKFQRAYQASLRVIQTADEMYGDLLALR
ncbi:MAG: flagellar hook-associated protein FlgK [Polyangiales bacterium]